MVKDRAKGIVPSPSFRSWTVAKKLWLGFGGLIFVLALGGLVFYWAIGHIGKDLRQVVMVEGPLEESVLEMEINAGETARAVLDYVRERKSKIREKAHDSEAAFEGFASQFGKLAETDEERRLGKEVSKLYLEFKPLGNEIMTLADQRQAALEVFRKDVGEIEKLVHRSVSGIAPNAMKKLESALKMEINIDKAFAGIEAYISQPDAGLRQEIADCEAEFKRSEAMYREGSLSAEEKRLLKRIDKDFANAVKAGNTVMATTDKMRQLLDRFEGHLERIDTILDDQVQPLIHAETIKASEDAKRSVRNAAVYLLILGVVGVLIATGSAWAISAGIIEPVEALSRGAEKIGSGNLDHRIDIAGKDELGRLGATFNRMAESLRRATAFDKEHLAVTLHSIGDGVISTDTQGGILSHNKAAEELTGWNEEDARGKQIEDVFHIINEQTRQRCPNPVEMVLQTGQVVGLANSTILIGKDGMERVLADSGAPISDKDGNIVGVVLVFRDVTEERRIQESLRESEERFRELAELLPLFVYEVDFNGKFTFLNRAALDESGYTLEDLATGLNALDVFIPEDIEDVTRDIAEVLKGNAVKGHEYTVRRKDGATFPSVSFSSPIFRDNQIVGLRGVGMDITERRKAEEIQTQLIEETKHFAYVVSHDLHAPLVNIKGFFDELKAGLDLIIPVVERAMPSMEEGEKSRVTHMLEEDIPESLRFIDSSVTRMNRLIEAVLEMSRAGRRDLVFNPLNMNELVKDILNSLSYQIEATGVNVTVGTLPQTVADRTVMEQIMGNLLSNALESLDPKRAREIEIAGHHFPDENVFVVRDTGSGIVQSDLTRIFRMFQRSRDQEGPGEGMGLAYARTLVRRHGGGIWCESEPGKGSTFTFTIANRLPEQE